MDKREIPASNSIPKNLLDIICILESDEISHSWKLIRNSDSFSLVIKTPAKNANPTPLKNNASGQPANRQDKKQVSSDDKLRKRSKRKKKSPSTVARDRSRRKAFWKTIKSSKKSQSKNARQQETRTEAIQPELDLPSSVSEVVKDPTHRHLTSESDTDNSVPIHEDLNELSAEVAEAEQSSELDSEELEFRKCLMNQSYEPDSDDDSPSSCAKCMTEGDNLPRCTGCRYMRYCSKACQVADWPSHKQLCKAIQALPSLK